MPRKPKHEKRKGVFERVKGSGIWWVRYTDERGKRVTTKVGTFAAAARYVDRRTEIRLGISNPSAPGAVGAVQGSPSCWMTPSPSPGNIIAPSKTFNSESNWRARRLVHESPTRSPRENSTTGSTGWLRVGNGPGVPRTGLGPRSVRSFGRPCGKARPQTTPPGFCGGSRNRWDVCASSLEKEETALRVALVAELPARISYIKAAVESIRDDGESALAQLDVALHTGMRRGEQFTVTWPQIDLERGFIYLAMTKNGSDRYVHLKPDRTASTAGAQGETRSAGASPKTPLCSTPSVGS